MELAKKYRESEGVIHAIHAHHNDVEPKTIVACLVQAADAISAARPGARRENLENYIKRLEMLEEITSSFPGWRSPSPSRRAGRSASMVKPEVVSEDQMVLLARDIAKKIEGRAGVPRPDQGASAAGDQSHRVREIRAGRASFGSAP